MFSSNTVCFRSDWKKGGCSINCLRQSGQRTLTYTLGSLQSNHCHYWILDFSFVSWLDLSITFAILKLLTCKRDGQQVPFVVVAFLMRLYSTMSITPEARGVCKIQAITGGGNIHIYLMYLLLDDSLLHLIQTRWISHLIFPFQTPF